MGATAVKSESSVKPDEGTEPSPSLTEAKSESSVKPGEGSEASPSLTEAKSESSVTPEENSKQLPSWSKAMYLGLRKEEGSASRKPEGIDGEWNWDVVDSSPIVYDEQDEEGFENALKEHLSFRMEDVGTTADPAATTAEAASRDAASLLHSERMAWDVAHGGRKESVLEKMTMIPAAVTRVALNIVGGAAAGVGYGAGKIGEVTGGRKAVDSAAFRAGFASWMLSNGIFPSLRCEPLDKAGETLQSFYGLAEVPKENDMNLTPVIVSNHVSYLDGVVLASLFGAPKIVAKAGARKTPVLGSLMEQMEVVFVEKGDGGSRHATLEAISAHCSDWAPGKRPLLIFPEGTTTNGEALAPFKKGAFVNGTPVRPVIIVYTGQFDASNPNFKATKEGVKELSDAEWGAQFMGHFVHSLHVRVLPPYVPSEAEKTDAVLYAANCEKFMAEELARVRAEVTQDSWKVAAGRDYGGAGYRVGDIARVTIRRVAPVAAKGAEALHGVGAKGAEALHGVGAKGAEALHGVGHRVTEAFQQVGRRADGGGCVGSRSKGPA